MIQSPHYVRNGISSVHTRIMVPAHSEVVFGVCLAGTSFKVAMNSRPVHTILDVFFPIRCTRMVSVRHHRANGRLPTRCSRCC